MSDKKMIIGLVASCCLAAIPACDKNGSNRTSSDTDTDSDTDSDSDTDTDTDADSDSDTDSDTDTDSGTGAGDCPVFFDVIALQGWSENSGDYMWSFEAEVWDVDGEDDVASVSATLLDPGTSEELYTVALEYISTISMWQGYALQADTQLECCSIPYDVTFAATDGAECVTELETTIENDEP